MTILKELCVAAGNYEVNGQEKTRWARIGHLHQTKDGTKQYITLDPLVNLAAVPLKEDDDRVYVNLFDPKPRDGQKRAAPQQQNAPADTGFNGPDEDIPF